MLSTTNCNILEIPNSLLHSDCGSCKIETYGAGVEKTGRPVRSNRAGLHADEKERRRDEGHQR